MIPHGAVLSVKLWALLWVKICKESWKIQRTELYFQAVARCKRNCTALNSTYQRCYEWQPFYLSSGKAISPLLILKVCCFIRAKTCCCCCYCCCLNGISTLQLRSDTWKTVECSQYNSTLHSVGQKMLGEFDFVPVLKAALSLCSDK